VTEEAKLYSRLVPLSEAAGLLGVALETLRKWIQEGRVESHKLYGRRLMSEDEICRLIDLSRIPARRNRKAQIQGESLATTA
jgi:excisionase family DNA binding protein